ncbi:MAG TPA: sigma-70 family RNA polymerase sigma factor [Gemmataceae bacterium]|nr:sigma-70 family RNA polymerase sigma factor [Gemmataceae bacterium]
MSAADETRVTYWLGRLRRGDRAAAEHLWYAYFPQVSGYVDQWLPADGITDPEDVAVSAFWNLWRDMAAGGHAKITDRVGLQACLYRMARWKVAIEMRRRHSRLDGRLDRAHDEALNIVDDEAEDPMLAAAWVDEVRALLGRLRDEDSRSILLHKLMGQSEEEIAARIGRTPRTVRARLRVIRNVLHDIEGTGE